MFHGQPLADNSTQDLKLQVLRSHLECDIRSAIDVYSELPWEPRDWDATDRSHFLCLENAICNR